MADIQANIGIGVDTSQALAAIRQLQREISVFHTLMAKGGAAAAAKSAQMQQGLINTINETGKFSAGMTNISSSTESFTNALEKNKLSMGQYFRYAGGASKTFGKAFSREFSTINRVAQERVKDLQTQYISMGRDANGALKAIKVRPLALDMDNLGTKVQLAAQKQQIFNQLMKQGTTNLLNFGKNTQWAGRQLMVGFTIPLTIFGATAAREFQKLEEQAVKFRRVYGDMFNTDADTEKALSNVRELAEEFTKYGIAVEKTIGLAAKVAQMGNVGEDLTAQVTQATRLAVLGGLEQEEALDTTISLTNAFGIAAEDLAEKIAFLNAAENQTILSIEDFNTAIPLAGSVVQQLGGNVEDLAFFLTAMREGGINASQGANALKTSLARLIAPTEVAKKEMAGFGIDIVGIVEKNAGNLRNTVVTLGSELDKLDPLNRARAIEQLFGKFQFARMSTMFQNIAKDGSQASKILDLATNSVEELAIIAERELRAVEESPAFRLQKQMEELKASLAPIGEEFIKAVGPLIEFGTKLLKSFNNLGDGGKQFVVILTTVAGVIAPAALMAFGLIANGVANLLKFFQFLGAAFGMLSGKSTMLGGQTEYMTQQQLEAAAVAASLGQSHSNLTQIFSAEASAVSSLVAQYRAAIIEQRKLSIGQTARGVVGRSPRGTYPKGFAKGGIIRGPGTGTSDSIPAMVSNGEAIIPARQTQKYHGLIEAIIANQVPGYATAKLPEPSGPAREVAQRISGGSSAATESIAKNVEREIQKRARHFGISLEQSAEDLKRALSTLADASVRSTKTLTESSEFSGIRGERVQQVEQQSQFAHFGGGTTVSAKTGAQMAPNRALLQTVAKVDPENELAVKHGWGMDLSRQANREMDVSPEQIASAAARGEIPGRKGSLLVEEMASKSSEEAAESFSEGIKLGGGDSDDPEIKQAATQFHQKILDLLSKKVKETAEAVVVDTDEQLAMMTSEQQAGAISMESIERSAAQEVLPGSKLGSIREKAFDRPRELRLRVNEELMGKAQGALGKGEISQEEYESLDKIKARGGSKDIQLSRTGDLPSMDDLENESAEIGRNVVRSQLEASKDEAGIGSPAKRFIEIGRNIVNSTAMGMQEEATEQAGKPPLPGNLAAPQPPVPPTGTPSGSGLKNKITGFGKKVGSKAEDVFFKTAPGKKMANYFAETSGADITDSKGNVISTVGGPTPVKVVNQVELDPALQNAVETGRVESENLADKLKQQQSSLQDNADTVAQRAEQDRAALKESKRQNRQARAGKALAGLGTLTMAAGMATQVEGRVGEIAQQVVGPMAALSGIAPMLMALPAPIAALVAVIGAGVAAWMIYNKTIKEARKEAFELTRALGSGRDAVKGFAEASGKATSSEVMDKRRANVLNLYQTQPGKTPFGESFLGSDEGQGLLDSVQRVISSRGMDEAQEGLSKQLQAALLDGSLTIEQARGIALAMGQELDDLGFSMRINAELNQIFGPEGENLLTDPLKLQMEFMEGTTGDILAAGNEFKSSLEDLNFGEALESTSLGMTDELAKVEPWLEKNVPTWFRYLTVGIVDAGAYVTAGLKGAWTGALQPAVDYAVAAGNYVGELVNGLESYQMAIDATSNRYDKMITDAEAGGQTDLASELRAEKLQAEIDILEQYQKSMNDLSSQFTGMEEGQKAALLDEVDIQLKAKFEDDPEQKKILDDALKRVDSLNLDEETEYFLKLSVAADNFSLTTLDYLSNLEDQETINAAVDVAMNVGGKDADLAVQIAKMFGSDADGLKSQTEFLTRVSTEDPEAAKATIATMAEFAKLTGIVGKDAEIYMNAALNMDDEQLANFQADMDYLNSLNGAEITTTMITEHIGEDVANIIRDNQEYFDSLPPDQQLRYSMIINTLMTAVGSPEFTASVRAWAASKGLPYALSDADAIRLAPQMIADIGDRGTRSSTVASTGDGTPENTTGGGGGAEPQVDSLITKLRDLRDATVSMKKGWEGMQETLSSIFAGGANQMGMFSGLEKQIRNLGIGEGLIAQIVGMDPDEYEKRKNELFEFDGLGNIVKAKGSLLNMNAAFDAVAIGDYVNGQEKFITKTKNQISAISTLTANGMSLADAYEAVQDEALAAAIAQGASTEQVKEILRVTALAKELEEDLEEQRERSRISEAVRKTNEEFSNQVAILQKLSKEQGKYSDEQIKAIMGDSDLQKLYLDPTIDEKALEAALQNAAQKANLEVQIAIAEGREDELFGQYLNEVNDYFSREEAVIGVNFEMDTADESKIVEDAQRQIAAIQYQLDDYNAELERISWAEEDINEKYDNRIEALDDIADANQKIAEQQRAQLDIADALSRGDIAAAARATAELRSQQAQDARESQKDQLERAREAELKQLIGPSGMTREQLEDAITSLERQVFQIEEDLLEPAQERIRLAEITRDLAIEQLELNGMTRDEFDQIAAATNLAALNMEDMVKSAEKLIAMGEFIRTGEKPANWEELFPMPKAAPAPASSSGGGGGGGGGGGSKGDWHNPNTGNTIQEDAKNAGYSSWQEYYNENRSGIDPVARPTKADGGLIKMAMGGLAKRSRSGPPLQMAMGGKVGKYANGGMIIPKRMAMGGYSMGSDIVPAILTPGEFVVRRPAVSAFGVDNLEKINRGTYNDGSVYNYNLAVNVKSDSDPNRIARAVITNIKSIENQRIRSNKL